MARPRTPTMYLGRFGVILVLGLVVWGGRSVLADDSGGSDRLADVVPSSSIAYFELNDADGLLDRVTSPGYGKIVADMEMLADEKTRTQWEQLQAGIRFVSRSLAMEPEAMIRTVTGGGVAIAFEGPEKLDGWLQARDASALVKLREMVADLAKLSGKPEAVGNNPGQFEHEGVTCYQLDKNLTYAIVGDRLVFASGTDRLPALLDRMKGKREGFEALAANPNFQARDKARAANAWGWAYANLSRLRELDPNMFVAKAEDEAGQKLLFGPWIESLRSGDWAALTLGPDGEGWSADLWLDAPVEKSDGVYAGFRPGEGEGPAPLLQPEGTLLSVSLYRDFSEVWDSRTELLPAESQAGLAQLDTVAGQFFGGRDFATGVLGALTPQWRMVVIQRDYDTVKPTPSTRLPGFALVLGLRPGDEEFAVRLQSAFQSFVGLANLGAAEQKAPPLMLGSAEVDGVTLLTASYVAPKDAKDGEADIRYNFTPAVARVEHSFVIASSVEAARALVPLLKKETEASLDGLTLVAQGSGSEAARLIGVNVGALRMNRMLEQGKEREAAEADVAAMGRLVDALGQVRLEVRDKADVVHIRAVAGH